MKLTCKGCGRTFVFTDVEKYDAAFVRMGETHGFCKKCRCNDGFGCGGSGIRYGRGEWLNGEFKGAMYECPRCSGRGWQTDCGEGKHKEVAKGENRCCDRERNSIYDNKFRRIEE